VLEASTARPDHAFDGRYTFFEIQISTTASMMREVPARFPREVVVVEMRPQDSPRSFSERRPFFLPAIRLLRWFLAREQEHPQLRPIIVTEDTCQRYALRRAPIVPAPTTPISAIRPLKIRCNPLDMLTALDGQIIDVVDAVRAWALSRHIRERYGKPRGAIPTRLDLT